MAEPSPTASQNMNNSKIMKMDTKNLNTESVSQTIDDNKTLDEIMI